MEHKNKNMPQQYSNREDEIDLIAWPKLFGRGERTLLKQL